MKGINISFLKNNLSAVLSSLQKKGPVTILDRDKPIAVLYPIDRSPGGTTDADRLTALEREGIVSQTREKVNLKLLLQPAPALVGDRDAVADFIAERRYGR